MKIHQLEIKNIRGIRDLTLNPKGKNIVIYGENDSGKSGIVDAVDFLLTGKIRRLMGVGTKDITLSAHGSHIDCKPGDESWVRATIELPGLNKKLQIERHISESRKLHYNESYKDQLAPILAFAEKGQHVLTREEVLKFIKAEGGTRAKEIQALLNLSYVDRVRKTFVKINNKYKKNHQQSESILIDTQSNVLASLELDQFNKKKILQTINENRNILGGGPIATIISNELRKNLKFGQQLQKNRKYNPRIFKNDLKNVERLYNADFIEENTKKSSQIKKLIREIIAKPDYRHAIQHSQLIENGIKLIDDSGKCPLCEYDWPPGELIQNLNKRLDSLQFVINNLEEITTEIKKVREQINTNLSGLREVISTCDRLGFKEKSKIFNNWIKQLNLFLNFINEPEKNILEIPKRIDDFIKNLDQRSIREEVSNLLQFTEEKLPDVSKEENAWDLLTRLGENLKAYEKAISRYNVSQIRSNRSMTLLKEFEKSRDADYKKI